MKYYAAGLGLLCHVLFVIAIIEMAYSFYYGLNPGFGTLTGGWRVFADAALLLQFPIVHSLMLSESGQRWLARIGPKADAKKLRTTTFALLASLQVLSVCLLWSPSGIIWWSPSGIPLAVMQFCYLVSWGLLAWSMFDAGLGVQTGFTGWSSVLKNRPPRYPSFPTGGLYRLCRQPMYLSFALIVWTGPVWGPDHLVVAIVWTVYCVVGPRLKERRALARYGESFREYQQEVPYFVPRIPWSRF